MFVAIIAMTPSSLSIGGQPKALSNIRVLAANIIINTAIRSHLSVFCNLSIALDTFNTSCPSLRHTLSSQHVDNNSSMSSGLPLCLLCCRFFLSLDRGQQYRQILPEDGVERDPNCILTSSIIFDGRSEE